MPWRCFHYTRVAFGISVSGDVFQCKLDAVYKYMKDVTGIADNMLIPGYYEDGNDHDITQTKFLKVAWSNGFKHGFD